MNALFASLFPRRLCPAPLLGLLLGAALAQTPPSGGGPPQVLWTKNLKVIGGLALAEGDLVYIGTDSKLYRTSSAGVARWSYALGDLGRAQPLVTPTRIYAVAYDDSVHALTPAGKLEWKYRSDADLFASPALLEDGGVLIASGKGTVTALSSAGKVRWTFKAGGGVFSSPIVSADGQTFYFGAQDGKLYALDLAGKLRWTFQAGSTLFSSAALDLDGTLYIGSSDRHLYAIRPDGTLKWRYRTEGFVNASPIVTLEGLIVVGSFDKRLYALNRAGELVWRRDLDGAIAASAVQLEGGQPGGERLVVGTYAGSLYGLSSAGEVLWQSRQGAKLDTSAVVDPSGVLYVGSASGNLAALKIGGALAQGPWPHYRNSVSGLGRGLSGSESARLRPRLDLKNLAVVSMAALKPNTPPPASSAPAVTPPATPPVATPPVATPPATPPVAVPPVTPPPAAPPAGPVPPVLPGTPPVTPPLVTPPPASPTPPSSPAPVVVPAPALNRPVPLNYRRLADQLQVRDGALYLPAVELLKVLGYSYQGVKEGKASFSGRAGIGGLTAYQDLGTNTLYGALEDVLKLPGLSGQWVAQTRTLWFKVGEREVFFALEPGKLERALTLPALMRPQ